MKSFKFFEDKKTSMLDMYYRPINTNYYNTIDLRVRQTAMRWIHIEMFNLHFRIYTHLSLGEVEHNITNIIEPLLFESNNHENRAVILRWLQSRFHRAELLI